MATIIMTFDWDGTIKKETKGFIGKKCTEQTKFLEALGVAQNRRKKASYYEENTKVNTHRRKLKS